MSHKPTICISHLTPELEKHYSLRGLAKIWERNGLRVDVGASYRTDADLCILHHDRTKLDRMSLPTPPPGVQVLNGEVLDISKRIYSTLAVGPDDDWTGPVIVKTNLNHFGVPEAGPARHGFVAKARRRLARISWRAARMLPRRRYPVLESLDQVPNWVWRNREYLVERFLPERTQEGHFCVRGWVFFGSKGYAYRIYSSEPLVKVGSMLGYEILDSVPDDLVAQRRKMMFDFGKFDYVEHDDKAILLDANKTPTVSGAGETPRTRLLAEGIKAFL